MDESRLRSLRTDVESRIEPPDFGAIAARGDRIRRRRTVAAGAGTALVVALTVLGLSGPLDRDEVVRPVQQPAPRVDLDGARAVLTDPDALVDPDASRVNGAGDMLAVVVVPDRRFGSGTGRCPGSRTRSALRWSSGGRVRSWTEATRPIQPLEDGFVVGAVPAACRSEDPDDARAYLVDATGRPRGITWLGAAERVCSTQPGNLRCRFDAGSARASLTGDVRLPKGTVALHDVGDDTLWARSADSRRLHWSEDGSTWRSRSSSLPADDIVTASAAGRWAVLAGTTSVEFSADGGRSWRTRDLTAALRPIRLADVDWTITRSGVLIGVTQPVGRGDLVFRSTDSSWTRFVETDVPTGFGLARPTAVGGAVYVPDTERWAVSTDDGATWRRTPALP